MYKFFLFIAMNVLTLSLSGQSQVENMLKDAKVYNTAYLDNDFQTFAKMTIPSVVDLAGGIEVMETLAKDHYQTSISMGMEYISIEPLKPSKIMLAGDALHAILPQRVVSQLGEDKYGRTAYYLASSSDEGLSWTFIDLEPYDAESIKTFVPSFTGDLEIPPIEYAKKIEK